MASIVNRSLSAPQTNLERGPRSLSTRCGAQDRLARRRRGCWPPLFRRRCVQSGSDCVEGQCRAIPAQLVYVVEERDVSPESGERSKEHCALPFPAKSVRQGTRVSGVHSPLAAVCGNGLDMEKLGQNGSRGFRAPAWQTRIAI